MSCFKIKIRRGELEEIAPVARIESRYLCISTASSARNSPRKVVSAEEKKRPTDSKKVRLAGIFSSFAAGMVLPRRRGGYRIPLQNDSGHPAEIKTLVFGLQLFSKVLDESWLLVKYLSN